MDDSNNKLKEKFMQDFINNIRFGEVVRLVADAAEKYAEEKIKNPKVFNVKSEKIEKPSLIQKIKSIFSKKEKNTKKLSSVKK